MQWPLDHDSHFSAANPIKRHHYLWLSTSFRGGGYSKFGLVLLSNFLEEKSGHHYPTFLCRFTQVNRRSVIISHTGSQVSSLEDMKCWTSQSQTPRQPNPLSIGFKDPMLSTAHLKWKTTIDINAEKASIKTDKGRDIKRSWSLLHKFFNTIITECAE